MDNRKIKKESKKILKDYSPKELKACEKGMAHGAKNHRELNRRPDEWYKERDKRYSLNAPKIEAFVNFAKDMAMHGQEEEKPLDYDKIADKVAKGKRLTFAEGVFYTEIHTLEVLIKTLTDSDNKEAEKLLELIITGRAQDMIVKKAFKEVRQ